MDPQNGPPQFRNAYRKMQPLSLHEDKYLAADPSIAGKKLSYCRHTSPCSGLQQMSKLES